MVERNFDRQASERALVVGVVGLGYVGLPLALAHAEAGFAVVGFDVDVERCDALNAGHSHIEDVADARLAAQVGSARMVASADATSAGAGRRDVHLRSHALRPPPDA